MASPNNEESSEPDSTRVARAIVDEMMQSGIGDAFSKEIDRHPGATIGVRVTRSRALKFYVKYPYGPPVWRILWSFAVFVTFGVIAGGVCGWLISKIYQWKFGPMPDVTALYVYRGVLFGALAGMFGFFQHEGEEHPWAKLSAAKKAFTAVLVAITLNVLFIAAMRMHDWTGTLQVLGVFVVHVVLSLVRGNSK